MGALLRMGEEILAIIGPFRDEQRKAGVAGVDGKVLWSDPRGRLLISKSQFDMLIVNNASA